MAKAREPLLEGPRVTLRRAVEGDLEPLVVLIREPAVARWWGSYDTQQARRDVLDGDAFVIEWAGQMIGVVLVAEESEPDYRHCGLDIAIATAHQGQGLGRAALGLVIEHLVRDRGHHRLTIDPAVENERAIRCYTALGFRPVGVMRAYERRPDGKWRDGLLMELIARAPGGVNASGPAPAPARGSGRRRGG